MPTDDVTTTTGVRAQLRAAGRRARAGLTPEVRAAATARAVANLLGLDELQGDPDGPPGRAGRVLLTAPVGDELDLTAAWPTLRSRGFVVALPRTVGTRMEVVDHPADGGLRDGWQDVPEPTGPATAAPVDVVVCPALALDRAGGRLGYGGGHFDRFLAGAGVAALRVGVVFACQLVERVPVLPHDQKLHVVVTERGVWRA